MTQPTTGTQPTPGAPSAPSAPAPQQPAPAPAAPPVSAPATDPAPAVPAVQPGTPTTPVAGQSAPAQGDGKTLTLTQAELDAMIGDRLKRDREAQRKQFAAAFGIEDPAATAAAKPEEVLAQAQKLVEQERGRANKAAARSFVQAAQIKGERVDVLLGMVNLDAVLKDVDQSSPSAVDAAIKAAVEAEAAKFPEWKATTVPGASTANPNGAPGIPNIDERIAAATKAGDHRLAISLKRAKSRQ